MQIGSFQWMKSVNKSLILKMIWTHGPISRAEIAKITTLTPPTVTNIVSELLEERLVMESSLGFSTGGRKPILLRMNTHASCVVSVHVRADRMDVLMATLDGRMLHRFTHELPASLTQPIFLQSLKSAIQSAVQKADEEERSILGVGIVVPGVVDSVQGKLLRMHQHELEQIAIREHLEQEWKFAIEVESDVHARALGENWFGQGRNVANCLNVVVGDRVEVGMIFNHQLYHGNSFRAGEIGHLKVEMDGPACQCGERGCLASSVSAGGVIERTRRALETGRPSSLQGDSLTVEQIVQAACNGDELAIDILSTTGRYLGLGLIQLVQLLNPTRVVLHDQGVFGNRFVLEALRETLETNIEDMQPVSIVHTELGADAAVMGGLTLILKKLFAS